MTFIFYHCYSSLIYCTVTKRAYWCCWVTCLFFRLCSSADLMLVFAGAFGVMVGYPFDTVKVWLNTHNKHYTHVRIPYRYLRCHIMKNFCPLSTLCRWTFKRKTCTEEYGIVFSPHTETRGWVIFHIWVIVKNFCGIIHRSPTNYSQTCIILLLETLGLNYVSSQVYGFYKGMTMPVIAVSLSFSLAFGTSRNVSQYLCKLRHGSPEARPDTCDMFLSGMAGGIAQVNMFFLMYLSKGLETIKLMSSTQ